MRWADEEAMGRDVVGYVMAHCREDWEGVEALVGPHLRYGGSARQFLTMLTAFMVEGWDNALALQSEVEVEDVLAELATKLAG